MGDMIENIFGILCVTTDGEIVNPNGRRFRSLAGSHPDALGEAVREKGFAKIEVRPDDIVVWAAPKVSTKVLTTLTKFVRRRPTKLVIACRDGGGCVDVANDDRLLFRLSSLYRV